MEKPPDLAMGPDNEVLKGMASKLATRGLDEKAWPCMNKVYIIEPPKNILKGESCGADPFTVLCVVNASMGSPRGGTRPGGFEDWGPLMLLSLL